MKLVYVCECCDSLIKEVSLTDGPPGKTADLTGPGQPDIISLNGGAERVVLPALCDDCREMLYGGPESTYFSGPALH
ncbi:MAG: hypothetical protein BWY80_00808 [Firmicutes bacterium ADurb.Bin456]|nr:MAG: hypothetical protein BWY80_00808 [Firmicutes bacterium ADurb.Bin456]